jgi:hypothetical protein
MPKNRGLGPIVVPLDKSSFANFAKLRSGGGELRVFVPYTSPELTQSALAEAAVLVKNLDARITLFAVQIVPFPLPLDRPDVPRGFLEQKLMAIAAEVEAHVIAQVIYARDLDLGIEQVLPPNSLIVMATKKTWWPTSGAKLARALVAAGHNVALLEV